METKLTGYPSIDKPWLKYYSEEAIKKQLKPNTIFGHLWENNKEHLEDVALVYFERKITYRKMFDMIEQCKNSLLALGIKRGDIVTIQTLTMPQTVVLIYALSRIGAVANLIYVTNSEEEVNKILKGTNSRAYFVVDSIYEKFSDVLKDTSVKDVVLFSIDTEMDFLTRTLYRLSRKKKQPRDCGKVSTWNTFMQKELHDKKADVTDDSLPVAMVYTGGTTGTSKAVVLTNRSINELVFQYEKSDMGFVRQHIFMDSLPPFIAFGITVSLHLPLCMGVKTVLIPDPSPMNQGDMFVKYKPNYYVTGPIQLEAIMGHPKAEKMEFSFLKILATGGEALPASTEKGINDFLDTHGCSTHVFQGYGMSELAATVCTGSATLQRFGTVGIPLPNTNVKIVEIETEDEVMCGKQGEVCIYAPSVMAGYFNNPDETNAILRQHKDGQLWIHTGDIGVMDEDGFLTIIGRIKRMINILEGCLYHKVFPKLLEEQLENIPGVQAVSIVGSGGLPDTQKLVAFIVSDADKENLKKEIRKFVSENFKSYEQPAEYRFIDRLPRTTIGKVDYRALEQEAQNVQ